jgi:hypothetical protein
MLGIVSSRKDDRTQKMALSAKHHLPFLFETAGLSFYVFFTLKCRDCASRQRREQFF